MSGPADPKVDETLQYMMLVLSHAEGFKPDYHAVAAAGGISSGNHAQKKFKKAVETAGFQLVNGAVVAAGSGMPKATPKKPRAGAKEAPESTLKKRKLEETEDGETGDGEAVQGA